jgi:mediator of RNA polymerase II transcription subunit 10
MYIPQAPTGPDQHQPYIHSNQKKSSSKNLTQTLSTLSSHTTENRNRNPPDNETAQQPQPQPQPQPPTDSDDDDPPARSVQLPPEIIDYVDSARNPDIYTREFVELVQRGNQDLKGKREAFAAFRDVLAREVRGAMPECRGEVDRVLENTSATATSAAAGGDGGGGSGTGTGTGGGAQ